MSTTYLSNAENIDKLKKLFVSLKTKVERVFDNNESLLQKLLYQTKDLAKTAKKYEGAIEEVNSANEEISNIVKDAGNLIKNYDEQLANLVKIYEAFPALDFKRKEIDEKFSKIKNIKLDEALAGIHEIVIKLSQADETSAEIKKGLGSINEIGLTELLTNLDQEVNMQKRMIEDMSSSLSFSKVNKVSDELINYIVSKVKESMNAGLENEIKKDNSADYGRIKEKLKKYLQRVGKGVKLSTLKKLFGDEASMKIINELSDEIDYNVSDLRCIKYTLGFKKEKPKLEDNIIGYEMIKKQVKEYLQDANGQGVRITTLKKLFGDEVSMKIIKELSADKNYDVSDLRCIKYTIVVKKEKPTLEDAKKYELLEKIVSVLKNNELKHNNSQMTFKYFNREFNEKELIWLKNITEEFPSIFHRKQGAILLKENYEIFLEKLKKDEDKKTDVTRI